MKKIILIILAIGVIILYSCEKSTDRDDYEPPTISDIKTSISREEKDSIMIKSKPTYFNINPDRDIDTLIIGKSIYISLRVSDNDQLAGLRVSIDSIKTDSPSELEGKTFSTIPKTYNGVFGKKDTTFTKVYFGNIPSYYKDPDGKDINIREGDYHLKVRAMDYSGNQTDSLSYRVVRLLYPQTVAGGK